MNNAHATLQNTLFAHVTRTFAEIEPAMIELPIFKELVLQFRDLACVPDGMGVDAHVIRTVAEPGSPGNPAPEGIHRDGRALLAIFSVARTRLTGGVTELWQNATGDDAEPLFKAAMMPGEGVLVNDRCGEGVFHFTSQICAAVPPASGMRDVIVLLVGR
jgi:hypothetical protein